MRGVLGLALVMAGAVGTLVPIVPCWDHIIA
jgi:hypothetical protein